MWWIRGKTKTEIRASRAVIEGVTGVVGGEEGITWTERCMFYTAVLFMDSCHFSRVGRVHHLAAIFCRTQEKLASMPSPVSAQQPLSAEAERDTETQRDTERHSGTSNGLPTLWASRRFALLRSALKIAAGGTHMQFHGFDLIPSSVKML